MGLAGHGRADLALRWLDEVFALARQDPERTGLLADIATLRELVQQYDG